ncbi:MAG: hypothetical protein ABS873_06995 [Alkalibacterium sp.]
MSKDNKKYFFAGLFGVLIWFIIDGVLMYAGIDSSGLVVRFLETLFG